MTTRRSFLTSLVTLAAAPVVVARVLAKPTESRYVVGIDPGVNHPDQTAIWTSRAIKGAA